MTLVPEHRCICNNGDIFALVIRDSLDARSGQVWPPLYSAHAFACPPAWTEREGNGSKATDILWLENWDPWDEIIASFW